MAEAFGKLPTQSAIVDGELVLIDLRGLPLSKRKRDPRRLCLIRGRRSCEKSRLFRTDSYCTNIATSLVSKGSHPSASQRTT